jgi:hypothetical protein
VSRTKTVFGGIMTKSELEAATRVGRPRLEEKPLTNAERSRRRRQRMRAEGVQVQSVTITPELEQGLLEVLNLLDPNKSADENIAKVFDQMCLEPTKKALAQAFADPNEKPLARIIALAGVLGMEAVQQELRK